MDMIGVEGLLQRLAAVSSVFDPADVSEAGKCGVIIWDHQRTRARNVTKRWPGFPRSFTYTSDATSFLVTARANGTSSAGQPIQRKGKDLQEFLMQRGWMKSIGPDWSIVSEPMVAPPRPLNDGKKTGNHFKAYTDFWDILPDEDPCEINHTHLCFDRALLKPMARIIWQLHSAFPPCRRRGANTPRSCRVVQLDDSHWLHFA